MASIVIQPEEWTPSLTGYYSIEIDSQLFELQSASKSYTLSVPEHDVVRFELHDGDQHSWDAQYGHFSERAELADRATIAYGIPLHISYEFTLEPGDPNTAYFMVLGQLHQNVVEGAPAWGPPFNIGLVGERLAVDIRYTGADGQAVTQRLFTDVTNIDRGHEYDIDIKALFDPDGGGRLVVTIDGITIVDYSGPLGYQGYDGVYWSEGIYRHSNATETVAATYGHLDIETGNVVKFPGTEEFIRAPELILDEIAYPTNGDRVITLTGEAKPGTKLTITEDGVVLGRTQVDSQGHFSIEISLTASGTHNLSAFSTDEDGRRGITSQPLTFEISTAADIVARMATIVKNEHLGAIILTDTHVLTVDSAFQMREFLLHPEVMDKIDGGYSFRTVTTVTGQASYDRQEQLFDSHGIITERLRYLADRLVYDEKIASDGSVVLETYKADGSWDRQEIDHGRVLTYSKFTADDVLVFKQTNLADGSREIDYFNPTTGAPTNSTLYNADGSRVATTYGITGRAYVEETSYFDKSGKQVQLDRAEADGTIIFHRVWTADGGMDTYNYNSAGQETGHTFLESDGSRIEATFLISGQAYSGRILHYDKNKVLTERDLLDADGHVLSVETFGANASIKVFAYDASMVATGYTLTRADHSYEVVEFFSGSDSKIEERAVYDASGHLVEKLFYDVNGDVYRHDTAEGTKVYTYDQNTGLAIGSTFTAPDGSYIVTTFTAGHEELPLSVRKYTAEGRLYEIDSFNSTGEFIKADLRNADGSREIHNYDPATHIELSYTITHPDKSREEANLAVIGKTYAQQFASYDGAGKLLEMTRKYGDAEHTVSFYQKNYVDGSGEVHNYDLSGRTTAESFTQMDGSRDAFTFTYIGTATTAATVEQTHFAAGGVKQWVDLTKADSTHVQTSYSDGVRLISHANVADKLVGNAGGSDTFVFHTGFGQDTTCHFQTRPSTPNDHIEFDASLVANFDELATMMRQEGSNTVITFSAEDVLVIKNVSVSALGAEDFSFV